MSRPKIFPRWLVLLALAVVPMGRAYAGPSVQTDADFAGVADGAGGIIIAWADSRYGERNIYAQRLGAAGARAWPDTGVAVCVAPGDQLYPQLVSDGAGGAIIAWEDRRSGIPHIYAQRVAASGAPLWTPDGVALCTAAYGQWHATVAVDGAGGAIVAWSDCRASVGCLYGSVDIYAQRVDAGGAPLWTPDGAPVCTAAGDQSAQFVLADGAGGAILVWSDARPAGVYAQRLDAGGAPLWTLQGVALSSSTTTKWTLTAASDGAGGALAAWWELSTPYFRVITQRVSGGGARLWGAAGVSVSNSSNDQTWPSIASDGTNGAIVAWQEFAVSTTKPHAQHVNATGARQWTDAGILLSSAAGGAMQITLVPDGAGGVFSAWDDGRNGYELDIYAQRVTAAGAPAWAADDVPITTAPGQQDSPAPVPDGAGGFIVAWKDYDAALPDSILRAQRLNGDGVKQWVSNGSQVYAQAELVSVRSPRGRLALDGVWPNPSAGSLAVTFSLSSDAAATIELLDVSGRRVAVRSLAGLGPGSHLLRLGGERYLQPGVYVVRLTQGGHTIARTACVLR